MTAAAPLMPALFAGVVALLATPWLARLGVWGIGQWLERDMADELRRVGLAWWPATGLLALAMTLSPESIVKLSSASAMTAASMIGLGAALLVQLARIDAHCRLLPDPLTVALLASGLLFHGLLMPSFFLDSMIGAAMGYGLLWGLAVIFEKLRGVEAMGRGDFAMAAGIGAWLGWQGLPFALVLSCVFTLAFVLFQTVFKRQSSLEDPPLLSRELAFGPALAAGAAFAWIAIG
jgi:prepilin signal peptidase PulO-like enzyme (type II secretory pathway)